MESCSGTLPVGKLPIGQQTSYWAQSWERIHIKVPQNIAIQKPQSNQL